MTGYTKLFSSIITSSIWTEDDQTRIVWITLLALADRHGEVAASIPGLARVAGVSVEACEKAIAKFMAPDPYSRTPDEEGRRIERIEGGWALVNHAKYRAAASEEDEREKAAIRQKRLRDKKKDKTDGGVTVTDSNAPSRSVTPSNAKSRQAEAEAEAKAESKTPCSPPVGDGLQELRLRIGGWLRRRPTTEWSDKENKRLKEVAKGLEEADLLLLERYYTSKCKYLRQDVMTLLNNWNGELDRARNWIGTVAGSEPMLIPVAKSEPPKSALEAIKTDFSVKLSDEDVKVVFDDIRAQVGAETPTNPDEQELQ